MSYIGDVYMVQAMIKISNKANQILNIVKAKYNLNDKSEAVEHIVLEYGEDLLEPELRPEFIERMKKIAKQKTINVGTVEDFRKRYGLK
jgi:hypothetical protein